jgi:hypothetical protein
VNLDPSALENAVQRLREGLARCEAEPNDEQLRDGLIQRFEPKKRSSRGSVGRGDLI